MDDEELTDLLNFIDDLWDKQYDNSRLTSTKVVQYEHNY